VLLNYISFGSEQGLPLLIAHGLFGSARNWQSIARNLARDRWVVCVDMRNHGHSFWSDDHAYPDLANDLAQVIDALGGRADVLGHSMGGKAAMALSLLAPEKVNHLIIADIAPVIYQHTQSDNIQLMQSLSLTNITRKSEAQVELAKLTVDPVLAAFFSQSLAFADNGPDCVETRYLIAWSSNSNWPSVFWPSFTF
jgi:esterase